MEIQIHRTTRGNGGKAASGMGTSLKMLHNRWNENPFSLQRVRGLGNRTIFILLVMLLVYLSASESPAQSPPPPPSPARGEGVNSVILPRQEGESIGRAAQPLTPARLLDAAIKSGEYLLRQQASDGKFAYQYNAQRDRFSSHYNLVRHAGTTYALTLLYEASDNPRFLQGARKGVDLLLANTRGPNPKEPATGFECVVTRDGTEGNVGGTALGVLALLEYATASGNKSMQTRAAKMGKFLLHQQDADGHFNAKYFYGPPAKEAFESVYYPGEAVLALVRLYQADRDPKWLAASEKGAHWLIDVRDANLTVAQLPHDHWLLMALNELYAITRKVTYYNQGMRIASAIVLAQTTTGPPPEWIGSFGVPPRSAPAATRGEGLAAAYFLSLEGGSPQKEILEALSSAIDFVLRCQVTPEQAATLPRPDRASGGFRESLDGWKIRMDFNQHAICALLGLREIQME